MVFSEKSLAHVIEERGQAFLAFFGGNNTEYYFQALPAFLTLLEQASNKIDLNDFIIILQQHPGAKAKNLDREIIVAWQKAVKSPLKWIFSTASSDEAQIAADMILYHQTSLSSQFVLAGITTIQVGVEYRDAAVRAGLAIPVNHVDHFCDILQTVNWGPGFDFPHIKDLQEMLGICPDWPDRLKNAVQ